MRQSSKTILEAQELLRATTGDFTALPFKFKKGDWTTVLAANNGKIPYGTLCNTSDGEYAKPVVTSASSTTATGIVFHDVDMNGSMSSTGTDTDATEVGSVFMHGDVYTRQVKFDTTNSAVEKAALNKIIFVD